MRDKIIKAIQDALICGKLSCEKAHVLAMELNVPLRDIGAICNELNIKITACQLGCF